jgi:hypothetical protein
MASCICAVGFEVTAGFDALAEIQGPEVLISFFPVLMAL